MITTTIPTTPISVLKKIEIVKNPLLGSRWKGVNHGELVDTIHSELDKNGIQVKEEAWFVGGQFDSKLNGKMTLNIPNMESPEGMDFALGVHHSNYGDAAIKFAVGAQIFICSNGMVVGDYALKRKHTESVNLQEIISGGVQTYLQKVNTVASAVDTLKTMEITMEKLDKTLMTAGREGLLSWSRIGQVDKEYNKPTFSTFRGRNGWSLYNAFTYVLQRMPADYHIKGMNRFREILCCN